MAYFHSRRTRFSSFEDVAQEFEQLYRLLNSFIAAVSATRAPNSEDQGFMWAFRDGATMRLYLKNDKDGSWTEIT